MKKYTLTLLFSISIAFCQAADISKAAHSNNALASDLYRELAKEDGNVFFSPFSLSSAMSMPYIGARKATLDQMGEVLHFDADPEENARSYGALTRHLLSGSCTAALEISNSLWLQEGYPLLPEFLDTATHHLIAGVQTVDYVTETAQALARINSFVESATHGLIQDLLPEGSVSSDTRAVIVNTIYLKAGWKHPFNESETDSQSFYLDSGRSKNVSMMHDTNKYLLKKMGDYTVLELPYYIERCGMVNLACYVVLPDEGVQLSDIEERVPLLDFPALFKGLISKNVAVSIPKFSLETTIAVKNKLEQMGLTLPFSCSADFSGITGTPDLFISSLVQKAKLNFEEKGTEASAATAIVMDIKCFPERPEEPIEFIADRPFMFAIADKTTKTLLFVGRLTDPATK